MTDLITEQNNRADNLREVMAAITMTVVGALVFMGMPVIVGALTNGYGLSEAEAGYLVSAGMAGSALASLLVSALVARVDRRLLLLAGLLLGAGFNAATAFVQDFSVLLVIASMAGVGAGIVYAVGIALVAGTHHTGRNFSILLFMQVSVGGLELYFLPKVAAGFGTEGVYVTIAAAFALATLLLPYVPSRYTPEAASRAVVAEAPRSGLAPWLCLAAVFFFYLAVGSFWAYIERLGTGAGLDDETVSSFLTLGNLLSLIGCGLAYWLSERVGQARPLLLALACFSAACVVLSAEINVQIYLLGTFTFFLFWNFIDIFQLGTLSELDHSGRYVALVPAFQSVGSTLGPAAAAWLLAHGRTLSDIMVFDSAATVAALLCFLAVFTTRSRREKTVAACQKGCL